jgi:hypothetical protein
MTPIPSKPHLSNTTILCRPSHPAFNIVLAELYHWKVIVLFEIDFIISSLLSVTNEQSSVGAQFKIKQKDIRMSTEAPFLLRHTLFLWENCV